MLSVLLAVGEELTVKSAGFCLTSIASRHIRTAHDFTNGHHSFLANFKLILDSKRMRLFSQKSLIYSVTIIIV